MARKASKCPPTVDPNQIGCVWNFSGMFDHHHHRHRHRHHRKLLSDESHRGNSLPGAGHARNQVPMLTFDEQLRNINIESKMKTKTASVSHSNHIKNDEVLNNTIEKSFWKKIKSRYENPIKKQEKMKIVDTIVVLKPSQHVVEHAVDVGCGCSYLHPHHSSTSKQQVTKNTRVSFNDVRKKLKNAKKLKSIQNMKCKQQGPEVFVEARRHIAERLRLVAQGAGLGEPSCSSSKRVSRTLERVLLSSPKHESMASFGCEPEGARGAKSLKKTLSGSSPLNQNEYTSATGKSPQCDHLLADSKFLNLDSGPQKNGSSGTNGCIEGSQMELNMDNDQFSENPSPVSVLDSFFSDNICSPTSTIESVELQIQPHRLDFEEHSSQTSSPPRETRLSSFAEDRRFISSYVNDIYQLSQSNWEAFLATDHPFEPSCDYNKLLHDCVKEVLVSLHSRVTFMSSRIRPFSLEKDVVNEVIERVDWHNGQPVGLRTLDHLVRRDIAKCGQWIDSLSDKDDIVFEVADETLQELIMEAIQDIYV